MIKISIVTVVYNNVTEIEKTILSVLNQTYPNIEYIVIDGGSTDGTLNIINKYKESISYWLSEPDNGIYDAMNKGINKASGEWINFMNSGDLFYNENSVKKIVTAIEENKNGSIDVIYGDVQLRYNNNRKKIVTPKKIEHLKKGMIFCHQSAFIRTSLQKKYFYNINFKLSADYHFFYNLYLKKNNYFYLDAVISSIDMYGESNKNESLVIKEYSKISQRSFSTRIYYTYRRLAIFVKSLLIRIF